MVVLKLQRCNCPNRFEAAPPTRCAPNPHASPPPFPAATLRPYPPFASITLLLYFDRLYGINFAALAIQWGPLWENLMGPSGPLRPGCGAYAMLTDITQPCG